MEKATAAEKEAESATKEKKGVDREIAQIERESESTESENNFNKIYSLNTASEQEEEEKEGKTSGIGHDNSSDPKLAALEKKSEKLGKNRNS